MDVTAAIDEVIEDADRVDPSDSDYANRRARVLRALVRKWRIVWTDRAWWFILADATITIPASQGYVVLPSDFSEFGVYGGVYRSQDGRKLDYVNPQDVKELRLIPGHTITYPAIYSIWGQDATTKKPYIQIETNAGALTLYLTYQMDPPTLDESSNVNNLKKIPERWHDVVLIPGVKAEVRAPKADALWQKYQADYEAGLIKMRREEKIGRDSVSQLPHFYARRWGGGGYVR